MSRQQCQTVPRQQCSEEPRQQCQQVPRQQCEQVPRQQCQQVPRQQCQTVPRQQCRWVAEKNTSKDSSPSVSAMAPPPKSANKYLGLSVRACRRNSAPRFPANNVARCSARCLDSNATRSQGSSAGTLCVCVCDPNCDLQQSFSLQLFNLSALCHDSSAAR